MVSLPTYAMKAFLFWTHSAVTIPHPDLLLSLKRRTALLLPGEKSTCLNALSCWQVQKARCCSPETEFCFPHFCSSPQVPELHNDLFSCCLQLFFADVSCRDTLASIEQRTQSSVFQQTMCAWLCGVTIVILSACESFRIIRAAERSSGPAQPCTPLLSSPLLSSDWALFRSTGLSFVVTESDSLFQIVGCWFFCQCIT